MQITVIVVHGYAVYRIFKDTNIWHTENPNPDRSNGTVRSSHRKMYPWGTYFQAKLFQLFISLPCLLVYNRFPARQIRLVHLLIVIAIEEGQSSIPSPIDLC